MTTEFPIAHIYDLSRLSEAGDEIVVSAKPDELPRLAKWLDVESVQKFEGKVTLTKLPAHRYRYDAELVCDLTQASIVSLEPVRTSVCESFSRELHLLPRMRRPVLQDPEPVIADTEDDVSEELDTPHYDLAAPLREELSLALDPYPRAPGEDFAQLAVTGAAVESPFAVLKALKKTN